MKSDRILPSWDDAELFRALVDSSPDATILADEEGTIVLANRQAEHVFGFACSELLGQKVEMLLPARFRATHPQHRHEYLGNPHARPMGSGLELWARRKDGTEFAADISLSPVVCRGRTAIAVAVRDVTDHRAADERVKASLKEKESLLKEIHHRVKNNLQVTSSLLKLQSSYIHDSTARQMFLESQNRIRSMALVHEKLYGSGDLSRIDLADYSTDLAWLLFRTFSVDRSRISLAVEAQPVFLGIESAVPCGLILNELLSNCLKHAFPGDRHGQILVGISSDRLDRVTLRVRDDGVGLPSDLDVKGAETLGLQLVTTLAEQLQGRLEVDRTGGTEVRLSFAEASP